MSVTPRAAPALRFLSPTSLSPPFSIISPVSPPPVMAFPKARNPLAFTPWPVTIITTAVYLALIIPILVIHLNVPAAPQASPEGLNLSEAWQDLQTLTEGYHPYNSHKNDEVRAWLLERIDAIQQSAPPAEAYQTDEEKPEVFVFDDLTSNLTFLDQRSGVYFEGTNILVYIRGWEDKKGNWWETPGRPPAGKGGVLVNAHYDSVSTGYGATDDGVGVVTCLQLIKYFLTPGHAPRRGLVVLFNNGEEDYLNGARAYSQHPMAKFAHTFLNLEGAGAGGRATLFRSSDTEVTQAYAKSKYPFGSVVSANGFELVGSQTDYVVFDGILGLRGLDVAFFEPRARYHTDQDDARHTSMDSLWHMLSAAVATTEDLVSDDTDRFDGRIRDDGNVPSGTGTKAVWFDLFGTAFAVFRLHTLFALSVTLLIVAPLTLLVTSIALSHADKMYLFRSSEYLETSDEKIPLQGLRGFFRFPFLIVIPTAVIVGFAYMLAKINPYIVHSSTYAVWSMMISAWIFLAWFVSCVADFARPSAFHRVYTWTWIFVITWALLVIAAVYENEHGLGGGYFTLFYFASVFLATWISYLELFRLPRKSEYLSQFAQGCSRRPSSYGSRLGTSDESQDDQATEEEPTESTSLLRGQQRTTFANYVNVPGNYTTNQEIDEDEAQDPNVYGNEQAWSASMPSWTWVFQLLLTVPINVIMLAPLGLIMSSALYQTGQDGDSTLVVYLLIALFTTLLFMPMLPYIHRYTYHIPVFLFLILIGTLIYNLVAFPFSDSNRLKLYFSQVVDLDRGNSTAYLAGVPPFVEDVVRGLPNAGGNTDCHVYVRHGELSQCSWPGAEPHVVPSNNASAPSPGPSVDWVSFSISHPESSARATRFEISGQNTRACRITMDRNPIRNFSVAGSSAPDKRFIHPSPDGMHEIRLWSRTWDGSWTVDVNFNEHDSSLEKEGSIKGRVSCLWSDDNNPDLIPALGEVRQYAPAWVAITKLADGLVEGYREFELVQGESGGWEQKTDK
ncbi:Vacuolar membrane protease [Penicillium canariense]|uniref:Peptide hydrolase n=1 Tax=Penicillium canariense TaxID=189055 RepID=A0A9W9HYF3_9EURO|nr:Vacuolar membrane protease [Penicillium canariense]KAJ5157339.1 Vacuolar membrane protease [Penicillium canariense]